MWGYSYNEIIRFYKRKQKTYVERKEVDFEFLTSLASAALGGGKKNEHEIGLDDGEGIDELSDEEIANLKAALGSDFDRLYPHLADDDTE